MLAKSKIRQEESQFLALKASALSFCVEYKSLSQERVKFIKMVFWDILSSHHTLSLVEISSDKHITLNSICNNNNKFNHRFEFIST